MNWEEANHPRSIYLLWIDWVLYGGYLSNTTMLDTLQVMQEFNTVADDSMIKLDLEI